MPTPTRPAWPDEPRTAEFGDGHTCTYEPTLGGHAWTCTRCGGWTHQMLAETLPVAEDWP